jgi:hypothetical protein
VSTKKLGPRRLATALGSWLDAVLLQDPLYGIRSDGVPEVGESALDSVVPPTPIFPCCAHHELFNFPRYGWTPGVAPRIGPFASDELAVPAKNGVRSDDRRDPLEQLPAKHLPLGGKSTALVIAQAETPTQLLLQNPVLLLEVLKDLLLFSIEPAC